MVIGNFQLQNECLYRFHFESLGFKCEITIMSLEWVLGWDNFNVFHRREKEMNGEVRKGILNVYNIKYEIKLWIE